MPLNLLDCVIKLWNFVDSINSTIKTLIIVLLVGFGVCMYNSYDNEKILQRQEQIKIEQNIAAEKRTIQIASQISDCMKHIQKEAVGSFDVLLLSYHNSTHSLQGLSYLFLNCIQERAVDHTIPNLSQYWRELDYIYYVDELKRIHDQGYLRIGNVEEIRESLPRLYRQLLVCQAKSATFYAVDGLDTPAGVVVILYKEPRDLSNPNNISNITPYIQKLAFLLNDQKRINY